MNHDEVSKLWASPENLPQETQSTRLIQGFLDGVRRRRRNERIWLIWSFTSLSIVTALALWLAFGTDKIQLTRDWSLIPMLGIPWAFALYFGYRFAHREKKVPLHDVSVVAALELAINSNRTASAHLGKIALLYGIMAPVFGMAVHHLQMADKISPHETHSLILLMVSVVGAGSTYLAVRYFCHLAPQRKHLQTLLREYGN